MRRRIAVALVIMFSLAGGNTHAAFAQRSYASLRDPFWEKFPGRRHRAPGADSTSEDDELETLAESWIVPKRLHRKLSDIPLTGSAKGEFWSGDYWRTRWGLTSYRYSSGVQYPTYEAAIAAYEQPQEWKALLKDFDPIQIAKEVADWSPSEKYDLLTGTEGFPLTQEQKNEGAELIGADGKIEDWFGLCHGWAPAAILSPAPTQPVTAVGPRGVEISFYPHDVRALVTLAWSNGEYEANFAGDRCWEETPKKHANGRIQLPECFDVNPATFHLALGNLLGKEGQPFLADMEFDLKVANHPLIAYQVRYFNPLSPREQSGRWEEVAVRYDARFKAADPFQTPLTRGLLGTDGKYDDTQVARIVGVHAQVTYLDEIDAKPWPELGQNETLIVDYRYDLELIFESGQWVPRGGEWHSEARPDFLWLPVRGSAPTLEVDKKPFEFDLKKPPQGTLSQVAEEAAVQDSYPLCRVVKALLAASSGKDGPACP